MLTAGDAPARPSPLPGWLTAAFDWQSRAVVRRHMSVYLRNWHTAFLPPAVEPVTMLLAFGLGLGGYVDRVPWQGERIDYLSFVAPGLLAYATYMSAVFQSLYGAFIRMRYQKTWEGQLTTQVELRHVVWGEVLWAALLATSYVAIVAIVLTAFTVAGLVSLDLAWLPVTLPIAFVAACAFGAFGLLFTAVMPTIDHMNIPVFLVVIPMGLLSGTYFPDPASGARRAVPAEPRVPPGPGLSRPAPRRPRARPPGEPARAVGGDRVRARAARPATAPAARAGGRVNRARRKLPA